MSNKYNGLHFPNTNMRHIKEVQDTMCNTSLKCNTTCDKCLFDERNLEQFARYYHAKNNYSVDWLEVARRHLSIERLDGSMFFKSVLKLDKNFHVYVHCNRELMQVEKDCNGTYLKLYFNKIH